MVERSYDEKTKKRARKLYKEEYGYDAPGDHIALRNYWGDNSDLG